MTQTRSQTKELKTNYYVYKRIKYTNGSLYKNGYMGKKPGTGIPGWNTESTISYHTSPSPPKH